MTAQISDTMLYKRKRYSIYGEPLYPWLVKRKNKGVRFIRDHTACERGYVANWQIVNDQLMLSKISGSLADGRTGSVSELFQQSVGPVLATWYTGELRCPFGKLLRYVHAWYAGIYEQELIFQIKEGIVVSQRIIQNSDQDPDELVFFDDE